MHWLVCVLHWSRLRLLVHCFASSVLQPIADMFRQDGTSYGLYCYRHSSNPLLFRRRISWQPGIWWILSMSLLWFRLSFHIYQKKHRCNTSFSWCYIPSYEYRLKRRSRCCRSTIWMGRSVPNHVRLKSLPTQSRLRCSIWEPKHVLSSLRLLRRLRSCCIRVA